MSALARRVEDSAPAVCLARAFGVAPAVARLIVDAVGVGVETFL